MDLGKEVNREKVLQIIQYLAAKIPYLYKTKTFKLLYLLDELSVKTLGYPVTWLEFEVWPKGPVSKWLYDQLNQNNSSAFYPYLKIIPGDSNKYRFEAIGPVVTDELSRFEMKMLNQIIADYGDKNCDELIDICHEPGHLWVKVAEKHGLHEKWANGNSEDNDNTPTIDFKDLIKGDASKLHVYEAIKESLEFSFALQR
jgi:uncharacterized phage-associated protein